MAQIFVSHSQKDENLRDFFSNAFAGTKVKAVFEEFEKIFVGKITSDHIARDIENSKAVFVILSQNVQDIPYTRDWVVWEIGVAKNRDIWVFEPISQLGRISVVTPYLRHYVIFDTKDDWLDYIRRIIESYDDSHVLPTVLATTLTGTALGTLVRHPGLGVVAGTLTGIMISDKSKERPTGIGVECCNCSSSYNIHIPQGLNIFRCPVCNTYLEIGL